MKEKVHLQLHPFATSLCGDPSHEQTDRGEHVTCRFCKRMARWIAKRAAQFVDAGRRSA